MISRWEDPMEKAREALGIEADAHPTGSCIFYSVVFSEDWEILCHGRLTEDNGWTFRDGVLTRVGRMEVEAIATGIPKWGATYAVSDNGEAALVSVSDQLTCPPFTEGGHVTWTNYLQIPFMR